MPVLKKIFFSSLAVSLILLVYSADKGWGVEADWAAIVAFTVSALTCCLSSILMIMVWHKEQLKDFEEMREEFKRNKKGRNP